MRTYRSNFNPYNNLLTGEGGSGGSGSGGETGVTKFSVLSTAATSLDVKASLSYTGVQTVLNNFITNIGKTNYTEYNIILTNFKLESTEGDIIEIPYFKLNLYSLDGTAKVCATTIANFSISVFITNNTAYMDFLRDDSKQEVEMAYSISGDSESGIDKGVTVNSVESSLSFTTVKIYAL